MDMNVLGYEILEDLGEMEEIEEDVGVENAYLSGIAEILGAGKKTAPLKKTVPLKKTTSSKKMSKGKVSLSGGKKSPHKQGIVRANQLINRALRVGTRAAAKAKAAGTTTTGKKTTVPLTKTKVSGFEILGDIPILGVAFDVLGAVTGTKKQSLSSTKPLTPVQKKAVEKHTNALAKLHKTVEKSKKKADKALSVAKKSAPKVKTSEKKTKVLLAKSKIAPTRIRGDEDFLGLDFAVLGQEYSTADYDPRFGDLPPEGASTSSFVSSSASKTSAPVTVTSSFAKFASGYKKPPSMPSAEMSYEEDVEPEPEMPVRGQKLTKDEAQVLWRKVPEDGVIYQGDRGTPAHGFGSWNVFYGVDGSLKVPGKAGGFLYAPFTAGDPPRWLHRDYEKFQKSRDKNVNRNPGAFFESPPEFNDVKQVAKNSVDRGWYPLIGNPDHADTAGLQYALEDGQWFWQSHVAPKWATAEVDAALDLALKEAREAERAVKEAEEAERALVQAEREEEEARLQADIALAVTKEEADTALAQSKLAREQAVVDAQVAAESSKFDFELARQNLALEAKQTEHGMEIEKKSMDQQASYQQPAYDPGTTDTAVYDPRIDEGPSAPAASWGYQPSPSPPPPPPAWSYASAPQSWGYAPPPAEPMAPPMASWGYEPPPAKDYGGSWGFDPLQQSSDEGYSFDPGAQEFSPGDYGFDPGVQDFDPGIQEFDPGAYEWSE